MVRSGKLAAHIEQVDPWGPTWVINDSDIDRILHPDQPLVTILPPEDQAPMQMLKDVREGINTLAALVHEQHQGTREVLAQQDAATRAELQTLREEVEQLRHALATVQRQPWWKRRKS